jgi:hypothetical protein
VCLHIELFIFGVSIISIAHYNAYLAFYFMSIRNRRPNLFIHSLLNKLFYGILGWREIWRASDLEEVCGSRIHLHCDGEEIPIPSDTQGIVLVNIDSYAGGSCLWAADGSTTSSNPDSNEEEGVSSICSADLSSQYDSATSSICSVDHQYESNVSTSVSAPKYCPQRADDGLIEVVCVRSSLELAEVKLGVTSCRKLCQGRNIDIYIEPSVNNLPLQLDGEPVLLSDLMNINVADATDSSNSNAEAGYKLIHIERKCQAEMCVAPEDTYEDISFTTTTNTSNTKASDINITDLLEWGKASRVITEEQYKALFDHYTIQQKEKKIV